MRIHATESGSQTHKTKLLLGSPLFLSIFSFIDSISIFVCYVPGTLTDSGKQNRPGRCPLEAHDFIDVRVQLSEDRYGLKGFLEMTVNRCTAFASYPAPMLWAMFAQNWVFRRTENHSILELERPFRNSSPVLLMKRRRWHPLPTVTWPARGTPSSTPTATS